MLKLIPVSRHPEEPRPSGVAVIAGIFLLVAAYLIVVGVLLLTEQTLPGAWRARPHWL